MYKDLADAHCHANFSEMLEFSQTGISMCVSACFSHDWKPLSEISSPKIKKSYGLFPDLGLARLESVKDAEDCVFNTLLPELRGYLSHADAVGETGLDARFKETSPLDLQKKVFSAQLQFADEFNLPIVIHCVDAWDELLEILREWTTIKLAKGALAETPPRSKKFLLHAAKCSAELSAEFEKLGAMFSFGTRELGTKRGLEAVSILPIDRIMAESDSAGLANQAENLELAINAIARQKQLDPQKVADAAYRNFFEFYSK